MTASRQTHRSWTSLALCAGLVLGVSGAAAEAPQAEVQLKVAPAVTPEEQSAQADAIARRGAGLSTRLTKMLGEARKDKDIMRANCVNRKLTEVNANARNVESRVAAFKDAQKTGDKDRSGHEFTVLSVLSSKFDVLDQEAAQCLGQSVFEPGASQVVTTVPNAVNVLTDPSVTQPPPATPPSVATPPVTSDTE